MPPTDMNLFEGVLPKLLIFLGLQQLVAALLKVENIPPSRWKCLMLSIAKLCRWKCLGPANVASPGPPLLQLHIIRLVLSLSPCFDCFPVYVQIIHQRHSTVNSTVCPSARIIGFLHKHVKWYLFINHFAFYISWLLNQVNFDGHLFDPDYFLLCFCVEDWEDRRRRAPLSHQPSARGFRFLISHHFIHG